MNLKQLLAATACAAVLGTSVSAQDAPNAATVLATVNGTEITVGHISINQLQMKSCLTVSWTN